jgi:TetR/AcrR family transcriptional regulator, tetracycline repressor protein
MPDDLRQLGAQGAPRSSLTSADVARAALAVVERDGLDGLSMRRLADGLGVQAASLYWHVQSKDHLLDLMAGELLSTLELPPPAASDSWRERLRDLSAAYYRFLLGHRDAGRIVAGRFVLIGHLARHLEAFTSLLRCGGLADTDVAYGLYALVVFIQGFVRQQQGPPAGEPAVAAGLISLPRDEFPVTAALAEPLTRRDPESRFFFGLDLLIDGLARRAGD